MVEMPPPAKFLPKDIPGKQRNRRRRVISRLSMSELLQEICAQRVVYNDLLGVAASMTVGKACAIALVTKVLQERDVRAFEVLARYMDYEGRQMISVDVNHFDKAAAAILEMAGVQVDENGAPLGEAKEGAREALARDNPSPPGNHARNAAEWQEGGKSITGVLTPCEERPAPDINDKILDRMVPDIKAAALAPVNGTGLFSGKLKEGTKNNGGARPGTGNPGKLPSELKLTPEEMAEKEFFS